MSFQDLNLDRDKITAFFEKVSIDGIQNRLEKKGNAYHWNFEIDTNKALIILHYKANGTTTLQYSVGTHKDLSREFSEKIIEYSKISDSKAISCSFRGINNDEFNLFEEYIVQEVEGAEITNKDESSSQLTLKVTGLASDQVTITFYKTTGTTLLQGRPLPIFLEAKALFCAIVSQEQIIENENNIYEVNITIEEVNNELAGYMPTAIKYLDSKIIKIMTPALTLGKINVALEDYSCFSFPALRGLEGYIRQLLQTGYKEYKNQQNIGSLFQKTSKNGYKLQSFVDIAIKNLATKTALEIAYTLLYSKRHPYFHVDKCVQTTPIICNKHEAQQINLEIFSTIESTYREIRSQ